MPLAVCEQASVVARSAMLYWYLDLFVLPTTHRDLTFSYVRSLRACLVMDVDAHCLCGNAGRGMAGIPATNSASVHRMAQNPDSAATGDCAPPVPVAVAASGGFRKSGSVGLSSLYHDRYQSQHADGG